MNISAKQAIKAFDRGRRYQAQAMSSRQRSSWRTPGTNTALKEWARADSLLEKAEVQFALVADFLASIARGEFAQ